MKADFHIAPDGDDSNPGTLKKPFATLTKARNAVRKLTQAGLKKNVLVYLREGIYRISKTIVFDLKDSGTKKFSITYASYPGEQAVLSGGRRIQGWTSTQKGLWETTLSKAQKDPWEIRTLFVNGRRATRARTPNQGYLRVVQAGPDKRTSFTFKDGSFKAPLVAQDAELVFIHDWSISRVPIKAIDPIAKSITLPHPVGYANLSFFKIDGYEPHARYFLENDKAWLDAPGEWYFERQDGKLSYRPRPGERMDSAVIVSPALSQLLSIKGDPHKKGANVENLHFKGITFQHGSAPAFPKGYAGIQAAFHEDRVHYSGGFHRMSAAVECEAASNCVFEACNIQQVGGTGLSLRRLCRNNRIEGCRFDDIGANGIAIGEGRVYDQKEKEKDPWWTKHPEQVVKDNEIKNCLVQNCGAIYFGSIGIWVGLAEGTKVVHNEVRHLPYSGISVGWMWNSNPTPCKGNLVAFNHIHHVMQTLSDGGGIYTLGLQPGTVLQGNHIHDLPPNAGRSESNGMFLDEGSSELQIVGNEIHDVAKSSIRFHKARNNTIKDNLLHVAQGQKPFQYNACKAETMTFETNTIVHQASGQPRTRLSSNGKMGNALLCDGSGSYFEVPHAATLDTEQLTIEAWVRIEEISSDGDTRRWLINKNGNEWEQGHYALLTNQHEVGAYLNIGGGQKNVFEAWSTSQPLKLGTWTHLACTYDGKTLKVFAHGEQVASKPIHRKRVSGNKSLAIGRRQDGYNYFKGLIDTVRLYGRALSTDTIRRHARLSDGKVKPPVSAGAWDFEQKSTPAEQLSKIQTKAGLQKSWRKKFLK